MSEPRVSVIIPAYRAAGTIGRAVNSLLRQTFPPQEIVVVDDGSPDDLASTLQCFGHKVTLIRKANGGAASARNAGIAQATGEFIAFLDADDYWEPTKLERQLAIFRSHPEVGLTASRFFTESPDHARRYDPPIQKRLFGQVLMPTGEAVFDVMAEVWTSTVVVRRSVLGDHRFVSGLEPAEDRNLWIALVTSCPVFLMTDPLATWGFGPESLSRSNIDRDCTNMLRVVHGHGGLLGRRALRRWEADIFRRWAAGHLARRRADAALAPAWQRLRYEPASLQAWWIFLKCLALAHPARHRAAAAS